jgi:hypothetical protein
MVAGQGELSPRDEENKGNHSEWRVGNMFIWMLLQGCDCSERRMISQITTNIPRDEHDMPQRVKLFQIHFGEFQNSQ